MKFPSVSVLRPGQLVRWIGTDDRPLMLTDMDGWADPNETVGEYYNPDHEELFVFIKEFGTFPDLGTRSRRAWGVFLIGDKCMIGREMDFEPAI